MELNSDTMKKIRGLIVFTVVIVVAGINYRRLVDVAAGLMHIVWPFILGAAIAFILNVPMRNIERHLPVFGEGSRLRRPVSLVVTILLVTGGLFLVIFVVAPQLVKTFMNLQSSIPVFFAGVRDEAERIFASNPQILEYMNQMEVNWQEVFQNMVAFLKSGAGTMLNTTFSAAVSIVSGVSSFLIGFIFRTCVGSATIAMVTAATMITPLIDILGFGTPMGRVIAMLACAAGGMMVFHGNDDFFWVTATTSKMDTSIAYKTIPIISVLQSLTALAVVFVLSLVFLH